MKYLKKKLILLLSLMLIAPLFSSLPFKASATMQEQFTFFDSGLSYTETTEQIINPDQGFYRAASFNLPRAAATTPSLSLDPSERGVYVVSIGLNSFSSRGGATRQSSQPADRADTELTSAALTTLDNALKAFRNSGASGIFRFSYDYNAQDNPSFSGFESAEPAPSSYGGATGKEAGMRLMEKHIEQLSPVLNNYKDVIVSLQGGMFGPWGEQHSTDFGDSIPENAHWYYRLNEAWLRNLDETIGIGVRKPIYFAWWASEKYNDPKITFANMKDLDYSSLPDGGKDARRFGGWNDGYLGSPDDWGTYMSRAEEVEWLGKQSHNAFGGEAIVDSYGNPSIYAHPSRSLKEMFITGTSYLNSAWNTIVHNYWRGISYDKDDPEYGYLYTDPLYNGTIGEPVSAYTYIERHLGYRYVLRQSRISNGASQGGVLKLNGIMENVGFGNSVNKRITEIILTNGTNVYQTETSLDIQNVLSEKMFDYSVSISLPNNMPSGEYEIYMKVRGAYETEAILLSNPNFRTVRFANDGDIWNASLGANKLGSINVASGSGSNSSFEEVAFEDFNERARSEAESSTWSDASSGVITQNGEGILDASWTTAATLSTTISNYQNKMNLNTANEEENKWYPSFKAAFVLKNAATMSISLDGAILVEEKEYPAGINIIEMSDISSTLAYQEAVLGKDETDTFQLSVNLLAGSANRIYIKWVAFYDVLEYYVPKYLVRFNANGGTLVSGDAEQRVLYGEDAVAPVYEREGYEFDGFSLSLEYITHDKVIFAIWKIAGAVVRPPDTLVETITINKTELALKIGDSETLTIVVAPTNADNKDVVWTTSDEQVAMVDQTGKVYATGSGIAKITATAIDGSEVLAECSVNVTKHDVIVDIVDTGTVAGCNSSLTVMLFPLLAAGLFVGLKIKR